MLLWNYRKTLQITILLLFYIFQFLIDDIYKKNKTVFEEDYESMKGNEIDFIKINCFFFFNAIV